jgi:hypothetical protein
VKTESSERRIAAPFNLPLVGRLGSVTWPSNRAIIADYDVQSAVERELVLRLAFLLWRLRRAATMETGLFEIQAEFGQGRQAQPKSQEFYMQG